MMEWTDWHEKHKDKIELVPGVDCWIWVGGTTSKSRRILHGRVRFFNEKGHGRSEYAHRAAYISSMGSVNDGKFICHRCGVSLCVRPSHLYAGNAATNAKDSSDMGTAGGRLTYDEAYNVRVMYKEGSPLKEIAEKYGIAYGSVYPIVIGKSYKHAPFPDGLEAAMRVKPKMNFDLYCKIKDDLARGYTHSSISKSRGVAISAVSHVRNGTRYHNAQATWEAEYGPDTDFIAATRDKIEALL